MSPRIMHFPAYTYPYFDATLANPIVRTPENNMLVHPHHYYYANLTVPQFMPSYVNHMHNGTDYLPDRTTHNAVPRNKVNFSMDSILQLPDKNYVNPVQFSSLYQDQYGDDHACMKGYPAPCSPPQVPHNVNMIPNSTTGSEMVSQVGKAKRIRTIFSPEQLEKLEEHFAHQQYMVGEERQNLAKSLGLTESQVKVWFQNRRIKFRKQSLETQAKLAQMHSSSPSKMDHFPEPTSSPSFSQEVDSQSNRQE